MRVTPTPGTWGALLCLFLCFNIVWAGVARPLPRQDDASTTAATVSPSATEDAASSSTPSSADSTTVSVTSGSSIASSLSTTASDASASPTVTGSTSSVNTTMFDDTVPEGELPLEPRITPGYCVAGVILILTGIAYTLIGIKTRWIHCFFSVAFLAAVGVTLLIVYVMNPPISNGIQGAFVVAVVGTGAALGGGGLVFKDITECLGCLLGGFCLSMWLLTLKEGGLLGSGGGGVIIFIAVFSAAGFAGYFSRWTRSYYMIACISFSGATAIVIGIDCFSRAGLKEYWAWIWDLNGKLFPRGANTYPLTRGIRVEQALTVILALVGVISQMKLWRIIKEHRAKKDEERVQAEAAHHEHEANVGRDIESANARERREWEAVYGDPKSPVSVHVSPDSGVGDIDNEEKGRNSGTTITATTTRCSRVEEADGIEMSEIPTTEGTEGNQWEVVELDGDESEVSPKSRPATGKRLDKDGNAMDTVHVAVDEVDGTSSNDATEGKPMVWLVGEDGEARLVAKDPEEQAKSKSATPTPNLVPLPFKVPYSEAGARDDDDARSSVAAVADEDGELLESRTMGSKRSSFAKRLSAGSADLFRRMSQPLGKQVETAAHGNRESMEGFAASSQGDNESVAATFESSEGGDYMTSLEGPFNMEIKAELASSGTEDENSAEPAETTPEKSVADAAVSTEAISEEQNGDHKESAPLEDNSVSKAGKSMDTDTKSGPASLTKDRLPQGLSKVALTYRTNEWAKHLSNAEMPPPEERRISSAPEAQSKELTEEEERAVPVDVEELRKTAANAAPPPAMPRTTSVMSTRTANLAVPGSRVSTQTPTHSQSNLGATKLPQDHLSRRVSSDPRRASRRAVEAIAEEDGNESIMAGRRAAAAALAGEEGKRVSPNPSDNHGKYAAARPISSKPPIPGVISYNSPQTLIGKRDMLMRVKHASLRPDSVQPGQVGTGSTSPNASAEASDAGSVRSGELGAVAALGPPVTSNPEAIGSIPDDLDDLPLSQRKAAMRRNSMASISNGNPGGGAPRRSSIGHNPIGGGSSNSLAAPAAFTSHPQQPQRASHLPSQAVRNSHLANPRQSVQQQQQQQQQKDPRATTTTPMGMPAVKNVNAHGGGFYLQPQGPLINSVYGIPGTSSTNSLPPHLVRQSYDSEVQRDIDVQRHFLMTQKQAENQKREALRSEREAAGRMFEQRMRTDSDMMELHRRAMRRIQRTASQVDQPQQQ
ncbi:hypothetical protein VMCG_00148 [Cytospora schulzeri]|uniref:TM7S3/TM198-like domain-containing protein n=1 Tax=Cytospora schulzeri TaxID=448051 RepID=A0A423X8D2_9PEZI|nr:hypothetical protein VMCG_00148 [Valsa malicola]